MFIIVARNCFFPFFSDFINEKKKEDEDDEKMLNRFYVCLLIKCACPCCCVWFNFCFEHARFERNTHRFAIIT